jgi:isoleucyl-tRNA synthetase
MSKSVGNVVDPRSVISGGKDAKKDPPYGADVLRLWVASVDYSSDVMIGGRIISQVADVYRKLRITLRFLLGNLHDFDPEKDAVPYSELASADRYVLSRFAALADECSSAYDAFQFYKVYQALQRFAAVDLSAFYLDVAKDRLYISVPESQQRRACQTTLAGLLAGLLPLLAPLLPHMAEDAWQCMPYTRVETSVFNAGWCVVRPEWRSLPEEEEMLWRAVLAIRSEANQQLEKARTDKVLGASLEGKVLVHTPDEALRARLAALQKSSNGQDELRYLMIVSEAELVGSAEEVRGAAGQYCSTSTPEGCNGTEVTVGVARAGGAKCARCWNYSELVGSHSEHPELCERCVPVVAASRVELRDPAPVG